MKLYSDCIKFDYRQEVLVVRDIITEFLSFCDKDDDRICIALDIANLLDIMDLNW